VTVDVIAVNAFVVVVCVVTATLVSSLRAHTQIGVQTAAIVWLVLGLLWALFVVLAATPCGLSGNGFLRSSSQCGVQTVHIVSAILGASSFLTILTASASGFVYAQTGTPRARKTFRVALVVAVILALALVAAGVILPRQAPSD
jgi:hypothetical protein